MLPSWWIRSPIKWAAMLLSLASTFAGSASTSFSRPTPPACSSFPSCLRTYPAARGPEIRWRAFCLARYSSSPLTCKARSSVPGPTSRNILFRTTGRQRRRLTLNAGVPLDAQFPVNRSGQSGSHLQLADTTTGLPGTERLSPYRSRIALARFWSATRTLVHARRQDRGSLRVRTGVDRAKRHYYALYDSTVPVPANHGPAYFGQYQPGIRSFRRPERCSDSAYAGCRPRTGCVHRQSRSRFGVRTTVEPGDSA